MKPSFGARLRLQREKRGVALVAISNQTKIKLSLLEAIERDDLSFWPRGLFGRAYIRAYAEAIGLEIEPILREYSELHPDPIDELAAAAEAGLTKLDAATPPTRISYAIRSAVGALPALFGRTEKTDSAHVAEPRAARTPPSENPDTAAADRLATVASVCVRLQRAEGVRDLLPILGSINQMLDASGVVLWLWDSTAAALKPWLTHGYPDHVVTHLPWVARDDDNAIAAAFRSVKTSIVEGGENETGAIVVPILAGKRCLGVLSVELRDGGEQRAFVRDVAVIVAALLARIVEVVPFAAVANA
jgi:hypothetical protein